MVGQEILEGESFHIEFGFEPRDDAENVALEKELKARPSDCDCDHLLGRFKRVMNGVLGIQSTGHRENSMHAIARRRIGDACFALR